MMNLILALFATFTMTNAKAFAPYVEIAAPAPIVEEVVTCEEDYYADCEMVYDEENNIYVPLFIANMGYTVAQDGYDAPEGWDVVYEAEAPEGAEID